MNDEYKVISEFFCCGKQMVTVRFGKSAHVISQEEWHKVYDRYYPERWKTKVDWDRFVLKKQNNNRYVS